MSMNGEERLCGKGCFLYSCCFLRVRLILEVTAIPKKTPPILPKRRARYSSYRRASYSRSEKIAAQEFQTAPQGKKDEAEPLS